MPRYIGEHKSCSRCGEWKPLSEFYKRKVNFDGLKYWCKSCCADYQREYAAKNPEKFQEYAKKYYAADPEKYKARVSAYYRNGYKPKAIENAQRWAERNREHNRKRGREYHKAHPEIKRHHCAQRRARLRNAEGTHTLEQWQHLCQLYDYKCLRCGEVKPLCRDHVTPLSKGGNNYISNIQPLCKECNGIKFTKDTDYRWTGLPARYCW